MPTLQLISRNKQAGKLEICNQTTEKADLYILGDIVSDKWGKWCDEDTCPKDITDFLDGLGDVQEIDLHINSGGGSVFAGIAIYNMLKRHRAKVTTYIDGIAASIASVIACAGDRVIIPANGTFMIHKPANGYFLESLNADQLRNDADILDTCQKAIVQAYMVKAKEGITEEIVNALVNAESWLVGEEAGEYFDFEVEQDVQAAACASDFFRQYAHTPKGLGADMPEDHGEALEGSLYGRGIDALADVLLDRIRAREAVRKDEETEKIKNELLGDLCLFGV